MSPASLEPETAPTRVTEAPVFSAEQQRQMSLWLWAVAIMGIAGWLGVFGFARLSNDAPLLLVALSPVNRHLVLVAPVVDTLAFFAVALPRILLSCFVAFQLGRAVGPAGLEWLDGNSPSTGRFIRWIERLFSRSAKLAMLIWPGFAVALLAGVSGVRLRTTIVFCTIGLILRLTLIVQLGNLLMEPIEQLLALLDTYWREATVLTILAWLAYQGYRRLRSPPGTGGGLDSQIP